MHPKYHAVAHFSALVGGEQVDKVGWKKARTAAILSILEMYSGPGSLHTPEVRSRTAAMFSYTRGNDPRALNITGTWSGTRTAQASTTTAASEHVEKCVMLTTPSPRSSQVPSSRSAGIGCSGDADGKLWRTTKASLDPTSSVWSALTVSCFHVAG